MFQKMGLFNIFISSLLPVLKVLLITLVGSFLAMDRTHILGPEATKHLNNLVFFVFTPALVATSLAKYITLKSMALLWFMPLNILITFLVGSVLGWLVIKITRAPRHLRGLVIGACSTGNLGNLPLILIPAVCKEKGSPFGDVNVCEEHGLSYATLSLAFGVIYLWLYTYNVLLMYSRNGSEDTSKGDEERAGEDGVELSGSMPGNEGTVKEMIPEKGWRVIGMKVDLRRLFAPSTIAAIVGFMVGVIPPFRKVLVGDSAPLRVIQDSAYLIGDAAIPAATLIVGANLLKGLKGSSMQISIVVGIMVVRFIISPVVGVVTVKSAVHFGFVKSDPLYQYVLMLQFAVPPAVGLSTMMTQLFEAGKTECSVILLSTYAVATVTLTIWSMIFMWLISR